MRREEQNKNKRESTGALPWQQRGEGWGGGGAKPGNFARN